MVRGCQKRPGTGDWTVVQFTRGKGLGKMQITDVRVRKIEKEGKMKAIVSITLDK